MPWAGARFLGMGSLHPSQLGDMGHHTSRRTETVAGKLMLHSLVPVAGGEAPLPSPLEESSVTGLSDA